MDIEGKIRSRIEAILVNDARSYADMRIMAADDEPLEDDPFAEERNIYQRIINSYRNAVSEVNGLLEENIAFLSGFYKIVENIKEKQNFQEICAKVVDCVLQDLEAEYCSIVFFEKAEFEDRPLCLEGIREERKFMCLHAEARLLGSAEFEKAIADLATESSEYLNIGDVYRETCFNTIDFPSVVRSLVHLPIISRQIPVGAMVLGHSMPHYFNYNHIRVLRILAGNLAHLRLLTSGASSRAPQTPAESFTAEAEPDRECLSIILLRFDRAGAGNGRLPIDTDTLRCIRAFLTRSIHGRETVFFYDERELLVLLPGTDAEALPARVGEFQNHFKAWRDAQKDEKSRRLIMHMGFSTCDAEHDLTRTLEVASLMMRPETAG